MGELEALGYTSRHAVSRALERAGMGAPSAYLNRSRAGYRPAMPPRETGAFALSGALDEADDADLVNDAVDRADLSRLRRLERKVGDRGYLARTIERSIRAAFEQSPPRIVRYTSLRPTIEHPTERLLVGLWSDIHFGLTVDPREVPGNAFNWQIAARRIAKLCVQLADWKPEHRDDTTLQIVLNGDIIAGVIHMDDAGQARLTEQIHGATQILVAALYFLRQHFGRIRVLALPGNHDRVTRERQLAQRWDSHAHAIYLALQWAFHKDPAITFDVPRSGDGTFVLPGGKALAYATHGDVAPSVGNISRGINTAKLAAELNKLNASGEFSAPVRVLLWGHWHQGLVMPFGNGTAAVNGCLIGADPFARVGAGVLGGGAPMQLMFESSEAYPFGDSRFVYVRDADTDTAYDRVVPTPTLDLSKVAA